MLLLSFDLFCENNALLLIVRREYFIAYGEECLIVNCIAEYACVTFLCVLIKKKLTAEYIESIVLQSISKHFFHQHISSM